MDYKINNFKVKKNDNEQLMVSIDAIHTFEEFLKFTSFKFELIKNELYIEFYIQDELNQRIILSELSKKSVSNIRRQEKLFIVEHSKKDISYLAFNHNSS
jgi:hypothetical protein